MIRSVTVENYLGDSITLELMRPEKSGFIVKNIEGLGPAKANINTTDISTNDGSIFNSSRLTQRNITMDLIFLDSKNESIEDIRQKSYKYFPIKKKVKLTFETDNHTLEIDGYVETNEPDIFSENEGCNISIINPDPYFYSSDVNETIFSGIESAFEFPFENNSLTEPLLEFGIIKNKTEQVVTYNGESEIGITIYIHALGEASNVAIANTRTNEKMVINTDKLATLTGHGIVAGDAIVINTQKGKKSIYLLREGVRTNILNCLEKGSKWFTLVKGDNVFGYKADSGSTNLQFYITNKVSYDGV